MQRARACVVCGSSRMTALPTRIAPFLREYVWGNEPEAECNFLACNDCTVSFYDCRPDAAEIQRLYSGYRGESYCATRDKHEPGYAEMNPSFGSGIEVAVRRKNLDSLLQARHRPGPGARVLDYGGDSGQFIPDLYADRPRYVYELSGVPTREGVVAIPDPLQFAPYDLVMCCHLLEHVSDPAELARELVRLVKDDGLIYFEVPWEPHYFSQKFRRLRRPPWEPPLMHEHINFFTSLALRRLVSRAGLETVVCEIRRLDLGSTRLHVLSLLASPRPRPRPAGASRPGRGRSLSSEFVLWVWTTLWAKARALVGRRKALA